MSQTESIGDIAELLTAARARLSDPDEAMLLVGHALGLARETLYAHPERAVSRAEAERALALVDRRVAGEPVAYLTGRREFYGLMFAVTPAVLIPRPETEIAVELTLAALKSTDAPVVADLGTGSGAIALAIAHSRPDARAFATDRSPDALAVAERNARRLGIANVEFVECDWLSSLPHERFDLIVSNPPYVAAGDAYLDQGDLRFEPAQALSSGADGLDAIRHLIAAAPHHLKPGGWLILEHGADQQPAVCALLGEHGYTNIEAHRDLANLPRAVTARR